MVEKLPTTKETQVWYLGLEDPLEKGMATYSTVLAWRIPWTEEPGGLCSQWDCKQLGMTKWLNPFIQDPFFFFFSFRTTYLCRPWDAIHFLNHEELLPQNPPSWKWTFTRLEGAWTPETGEEAYVFCPWPGRIGIWQEKNRKMTDLELWAGVLSFHGEYTVAYCLCTLSEAVAASLGRHSLFIEEHCFSFPKAPSERAVFLWVHIKLLAWGEWWSATFNPRSF